MKSFLVRNVSEALCLAKQALEISGVLVKTRNGAAYEFPGPVVTTYTHPRERVLFYKERDANPFFHFMESMWMLAGRNDVDWIMQFNGRMNTYSDDGVTFHGAYGHRWRTWFNKDQLEIAQHSEVLRVALGEHTLNSLLENKRIEWDSYRSAVTDYEIRRYLPTL